MSCWNICRRVIDVSMRTASVLVLLGLLALFLGQYGVGEYHSRVEFSSDAWKHEELIPEGVRLTMVDALLADPGVVGRSRSQIDDLLGKPDETSYFRDYDYVYWLGPERGKISIDSEWLGLKFRSDVVVEAHILTD